MKKPRGGKRFEKGNKAGKGRPPVPADLAGVQLLTQDHVKRKVTLFFEKPLDELRAIADSPSASSLDAIVAEILVKAKMYGDFARLNFLFERCIGKVKDEREVVLKVELPSIQEARQILEADYAMLPAGTVEVEEL